jgi:predicted transcriptional regulator
MVFRKKKTQTLTPLELEIMQALWKDGPGNVQAVQQRLPESQSLAYTTVQTMLNILHRKGHVKRTLRGRAYEYRPALSEDQALGRALRDVVDRMFGGSAEQLVMSLIQTRQTDPERIAALLRRVAEEEKKHDDA